MDKKYDETPKQKLDRALNQPEQTKGFVFFADLESAIKCLCYHLEKDKEPNNIYNGWQSNIAMAFVDAFNSATCGNAHTNISNMTLNVIANNAAKNFLNSLCNQSKNIEQQKP